jgi:hypothetical protein
MILEVSERIHSISYFTTIRGSPDRKGNTVTGYDDETLAAYLSQRNSNVSGLRGRHLIQKNIWNRST